MRLETLVSMSGLQIPNEAVRKYISSAVNVIIQIARLVDGSRKVISLQEITGMEGNVITTQEIFSFKQTGLDKNGSVKGRFEITRILPRFIEKFKALGVAIPQDIFNSDKVLEV